MDSEGFYKETIGGRAGTNLNFLSQCKMFSADSLVKVWKNNRSKGRTI